MSYEQHNIYGEAHYYLVKIVGGKINIQDPDNLIYDIAWKDINEIKSLALTFPEDKDFLINYITNVMQT